MNTSNIYKEFLQALNEYLKLETHDNYKYYYEPIRFECGFFILSFWNLVEFLRERLGEDNIEILRDNNTIVYKGKSMIYCKSMPNEYKYFEEYLSLNNYNRLIEKSAIQDYKNKMLKKARLGK